MGSFSGLEIAKRAIMAHQTAIDITGNNIANAGTEGYTRRRVQLVEARPGSVPVASGKQVQVGTGVDVETINRIRSSYADLVVRQDNTLLEQTRAELDGASRLDAYLTEPGDSGFGEIINGFWNAFSALQMRSNDTGLRNALIDEGQAVVIALKQTGESINSTRKDVQESIFFDVSKINDLASQIAVLNDSITDAISLGREPLDLLDDRDRLIDDLSKFIDVKVLNNNDGTVSIISGNTTLVDRKNAASLSVKLSAESSSASGQITIQTSFGSVFRSSGGKLHGELKFINETLSGYKDQLDSIATKLAVTVNAIHTQGIKPDGSAGSDFFTFRNPLDINNPTRRLDPNNPGQYLYSVEELEVAVSNAGDIAADKEINGEIHHGENALALSRLRDAGPAGENVNELYTSLVMSVGSDVERLTRNEEMYTASLEQGLNMRDQVSGVSIDEETMNLVKYEAGYNAAAKLISVLDEMLQTLIELGS